MACSRGGQSRLANPGDADGIGQIGRGGATLDDRSEEIQQFDCLEIVEAEPVRGRRNEPAIVRMICIDQNPAEAGRNRLLTRLIDLKLVQAFAIKHQCSLLADQFEPDVHLPAMGDTTGLDQPGRTTFEAERQRRPILVADRLFRCWRTFDRARLVKGLDLAREPRDGAAQQAGDREDVPAQIAERAAPPGQRGIEAPGKGCFGVREVILVVSAAEMQGPTHHAGFKQTLRLANHGCAKVSQPDTVGNAGPGRSLGDLPSLGGREAHGLLTKQMLALRHRVERDLSMREAWRGKDHGVGAHKRAFPICRPVAEAEAAGLCLSPTGVRVDEDGRLNLERVSPERRVHGVERKRMAAADKPRAEQRCADWPCHAAAKLPLGFLRCYGQTDLETRNSFGQSEGYSLAGHSFPSDLIALERGSKTALHLQLAERLRDLILAGQLPAGQKLPSIRAFAQAHGISRNTVVSALEQLSAEGYLESRPGAGIWVGSQVPRALSEAPLRQEPPANRLSLRGEAMANQPRIRSIPGHPTFQPGTPASDSFPFKTWARLLKRNASPAGDERLNYHSINGLLALRENIAQYVSASRGVRVSPDRIVVTTGGQGALDLVARLLVDPGDTVLIEEPGYQGAQSVFAAAGANLRPFPVTEAGWDLDAVTAQNPRAIYVTPSSQFPLGVAMSLQERLTLIDHARRHGSWILEDDYDSEYSFHARRIPALQSLVEDAPVIYLGTFSKLIFPSLRLGYMILPGNLSDRVKNAISFTGHYAPLFLQAALSDFIADGHFSRHLSRMRRLYHQRREVFLSLCAQHLQDAFRPLDFRSGIQITCLAEDQFDDVTFVERLRTRNLNPAPLSSYYCHSKKKRGLVMGYAAVDEAAMASGMAEIAAILNRRPG